MPSLRRDTPARSEAGGREQPADPADTPREPAGETGTAARGGTASATGWPILRLPATRSTNGPAHVHSGFVPPGDGWTQAATPSASSRCHTGS